MSNVKQKWTSVSIPLKVFGRIKAILGFVVDESLAEYVRQAIQIRLLADEIARAESAMEEKEIKERLKD